ncbi:MULTISPECIES: hypothetical protein [Acinetobacter]|uniref:hypothetical protein n=1 Tax=Acinetobacter TaxID=469 RepID=UPI00138E0A7D|nr:MULTISPECIES: hypothetical protein [Acinetobacter]MCA4802522.1 hypothetical protein [Acinetobacter towneri]MCO8056613.1 hypothetical protein [Acinetobacter towneri]QTD65587.1 hypothetical protein J4G46_02165 [Acinetobacter towneri]GIT82932.1 hypothetical protein DSM16313_07140 [Acinetobacter seohaensis]
MDKTMNNTAVSWAFGMGQKNTQQCGNGKVRQIIASLKIQGCGNSRLLIDQA